VTHIVAAVRTQLQDSVTWVSVCLGTQSLLVDKSVSVSDVVLLKSIIVTHHSAPCCDTGRDGRREGEGCE